MTDDKKKAVDWTGTGSQPTRAFTGGDLDARFKTRRELCVAATREQTRQMFKDCDYSVGFAVEALIRAAESYLEQDIKARLLQPDEHDGHVLFEVIYALGDHFGAEDVVAVAEICLKTRRARGR